MYQFKEHLQEAITHNSRILDEVLQKSPFNKHTPEYQNLKISILLTSNQILKNKKKLDAAPQSIILWHLPKNMSSYAKVLLKEFFMALKLEIMDCYRSVNLSEDDLENILASVQENTYNEDQY